MNDIAKVKNITFISAYENLAPDDYCDRMIEAFNNLRETSSAWSGSESNGKGNRKDYSFMFNREVPCLELATETNSILNIGLKKYVEEYPSLEPLHYFSQQVKVQKTPPKGGFHLWHCEQGPHNEPRMLTWTIYLNDMPEGEAETEFLEYGIKVQPKKGTVCFFPAAWTHTHRGNPVYTQDKYIATGWYNIAPVN